MASLNLSVNGPSIKSSYAGVVNGPPPSSSSPTYAQWALFSVQAPLMNAFQDSGARESVLKVEGTGDGELADLIEDFNEGRIQFAFVKVKDPNTALPKNVLIAWCGGGVPERTKGYFTSHLAAVAKVLHGYHVQITARSDSDLAPESIIQKVSDASGAKYTAGGSAPGPIAAPPVAKKPVFTPTTSSSGGSFNPLVAARNRRQENVDEDGWGADAPPVTRSQIERVESAYKPTKVNMAELTKQRQEPSQFSATRQDDQAGDLVRGGYQPVGKVDIAAIRAAAQRTQDDRPVAVKGAYEPVGKVDIAAIRARAQKPAEPAEEEPSERPQSLAERSSAFMQSERLTTLPKPKVANKFGAAAAFTGTKAPTPGGLGFGAPSVPAAAPVGAASRTFADSGGKTPAQLWAEKKAQQQGDQAGAVPAPMTSPLGAQKSGEWRSGYSGKSWATVQTGAYGRGISGQKTGDTVGSDQDAPASPSGGVSALRDRFKDAAPMGGVAAGSRGVPSHDEDEYAPPPLPAGSRPPGAFAIPGMAARPVADEAEEEEEEAAAPPIPTRTYEEEEEEEEREPSPVRVAMPISRGAEFAAKAPRETLPIRAPPPPVEREPEPEPEPEPPAAQSGGGKTAVVQYDYEKAEDNEIDLGEGEHVTNIDMVDDDWWLGTNARGETGLFPSNYVELADGSHPPPTASHAAPPPPPAAEPEAEPAAHHEGAASGAMATALFDYEAAEDNELSFAEGAKISNLEFPDEDWWFGHHNGASGLFPANYVQLDS